MDQGPLERSDKTLHFKGESGPEGLNSPKTQLTVHKTQKLSRKGLALLRILQNLKERMMLLFAISNNPDQP